MFPGVNPKQMQAMVKQMGIAQTEIPAKRVIIECSDKNIIIENPDVMRIKMQGQESWQITGESKEVSKEEKITPEDIKMVMEKTSCTKEEAKSALEKANGDIAEAIMELS